jgi:hypothetical protein
MNFLRKNILRGFTQADQVDKLVKWSKLRGFYGRVFLCGSSVLLASYFYRTVNRSEIKQVISYENFYDDLANGRIERIRIVNDYIKGLYKDAVIVKNKNN